MTDTGKETNNSPVEQPGSSEESGDFLSSDLELKEKRKELRKVIESLSLLKEIQNHPGNKFSSEFSRLLNNEIGRLGEKQGILTQEIVVLSMKDRAPEAWSFLKQLDGIRAQMSEVISSLDALSAGNLEEANNSVVKEGLEMIPKLQNQICQLLPQLEAAEKSAREFKTQVNGEEIKGAFQRGEDNKLVNGNSIVPQFKNVYRETFDQLSALEKRLQKLKADQVNLPVELSFTKNLANGNGVENGSDKVEEPALQINDEVENGGEEETTEEPLPFDNLEKEGKFSRLKGFKGRFGKRLRAIFQGVSLPTSKNKKAIVGRFARNVANKMNPFSNKEQGTEKISAQMEEKFGLKKLLEKDNLEAQDRLKLLAALKALDIFAKDLDITVDDETQNLIKKVEQTKPVLATDFLRELLAKSEQANFINYMLADDLAQKIGEKLRPENESENEVVTQAEKLSPEMNLPAETPEKSVAEILGIKNILDKEEGLNNNEKKKLHNVLLVLSDLLSEISDDSEIQHSKLIATFLEIVKENNQELEDETIKKEIKEKLHLGDEEDQQKKSIQYLDFGLIEKIFEKLGYQGPEQLNSF